ncbi:MAG TPA: FmdB family zinc ribbon protein [Thermoanaerobaculia bacterium]|nr:FmdB family zinc ribbon protein [Thermoanaerobaculia bacterium]
MPLYEYQCLQCGKKTEHLQRFSDSPLAVCPACGGPLKKLVSSPAFQFKGSGWYATDYAAKKGSGTDVAPAADSQPAAGDKSDAKPTGKPESKPESAGGQPAAASAASKPAGETGTARSKGADGGGGES